MFPLEQLPTTAHVRAEKMCHTRRSTKAASAATNYIAIESAGSGDRLAKLVAAGFRFMCKNENRSPEPKIGGRTIEQWNDKWEQVEGGFNVPHHDLHGIVGLYRADLNGIPQFMGSATDFNRGGLYKRLQTLQSPLIQSGNDYKSGQFIRQNIDRLTLRVIRVGTGAGLELITSEICRRMRKKLGLKRGLIGGI